MTDAYIFDHLRSPRGRGKAGGALNAITPINLATQVLACLRDLKDSSSHHHPSSREDDNTAAEKAEEQSKNFALLLVEEYIAEDEAYMQVAGEKLKDNGKKICIKYHAL